MAYVILHPDDLVATADIDYVFKLRSDLAEHILTDKSNCDFSAALHKINLGSAPFGIVEHGSKTCFARFCASQGKNLGSSPFGTVKP